MRELLTSTQVARVLGVSAATVKRWADAGALPYERTTGGHRRFSQEALERLLAERSRAEPLGVDRWIDALIGKALPMAIEAMLLDERSRRSSWLEVAEALSEVIEEIGARWERGTLSVLDEHVASARLTRALGRSSDSLAVRAGAPTALLATPSVEFHTLGLSLVELCVREAGWSTVWAGASVPTSDLEAMTASGRVQLVLLSAGVHSPAAPLAEVASRLAEVAEPRGIPLVAGGRGPWPEDAPRLTVLREFQDLRAWMTSNERRGLEPRVNGPRQPPA